MADITADMSAEDFADRLIESQLLDIQQLEAAWSDIGSRDISLEQFQAHLLRKELLTNFQVERLMKGERTGYFYGEYKALYLIGKGTFARVYRAGHKDEDRIYAVKVLRKTFRDQPEQLENFLREGMMGMKLRHANIVPIHEVNDSRFAPFMVMDFIEGQNLREFVRLRKRLEMDVAIRLITDIVRGLEYAAKQGICHRDLKLSNVLITSRGQAKLVDFGLAAAIPGSATDEVLADCPNARTIDYAGLERLSGVRKDDSRSDIFFAGCMLYHILSGEPPLLETRDRLKRLSAARFQNIKPIEELVADLPHHLVALLNKSMQMDPKKRFQTPGEMLAELTAIAERIARGEVQSAEAKTPRSMTRAARKSALAQEGESRTIMVVESDARVQDILREKLKRRGYRVLVLSSPQRALERFEAEQDFDGKIVADCVVLCTEKLGSSALEAFSRFAEGEKTRDIPVVLLIDPKHADAVDRNALAPHRIMMSLPIKVKELRAQLRKLLKNTASKEG